MPAEFGARLTARSTVSVICDLIEQAEADLAKAQKAEDYYKIAELKAEIKDARKRMEEAALICREQFKVIPGDL